MECDEVRYEVSPADAFSPVLLDSKVAVFLYFYEDRGAFSVTHFVLL
jgi:hypothetical protein